MTDLITHSEHLIKAAEEKYIIEQAKDSPRHFQPLYERYFSKIFRFLLKRHCDITLAEEITSQTFLKAITKINSFHYKEGGFSSWLYKIALNESNTYFRRSKKYKLVLLDDTIAAQLMDEVASIYSDKAIEGLTTAVQQLNKNQIEIIQLRFYAGMSFRQIGEVLSISENNAKVRCYRIIDKIRLLMPRS